uniref:U-box domain-containing protein 6-like n=1 Tax=Erigeron canadensis TaxID=72917 RepID=UPI001CB9A35B|nr:U-box domain-containing protein 6-like [Erigeron canadensis]
MLNLIQQQKNKMEKEEETERCNENEESQIIDEISNKLINGDVITKTEAARDMRSMIRNRNSCSGKIRVKFAGAGVIQPLVLMLSSQYHDAREASLLALLNLASRNERNKEQIVTCGAIPPLVKLLKFQDTSNLRELATAAILTLSATPNNKPAIANSEAVSLLIQSLSCGTIQGKVDAVTALYNLTTSKEEPTIVLDTSAALPLINLLRESRKYSKFADKIAALIELISKSEKGILAITEAEDGILTLVETIEDGSLVSTEHAVGTLLALCMSSRSKYRELILNEGAIPGLLRLTVYGTYKAQNKAKMLLNLLRNSSSEKRPCPFVLEEIVRDIAARIDGSGKTVKIVKKMLQDMVQRSIAKGSSCRP